MEKEETIGGLDLNSVKPIREIVYDHLRTAILRGVIKSGERIVEKEYAGRFGISRTPVREALRKLETEGFVQYVPRKGVVVKTFGSADIIEIYNIRIALETMAIVSAVENITAGETRRLQDTVRLMEMAWLQGDTAEFTQMCRLLTISLWMLMPRLTGLIYTADYLRNFENLAVRRNAQEGRCQ